MKKVIGIVGEGPTDYMILKEVIDHITNSENTYYRLQPEANVLGEYGNGWKGVWKWCEDNADHLDEMFEEVSPKMDLLIVHMDGDVSRKEKEVHCYCAATGCEEKGKVPPLQCTRNKQGACPIILPCINHDASISGAEKHLETCIRSWLKISDDKNNVVITIPCDSTEAWIVAAYQDAENPETVENPWESVISKKKAYHEIRITGKKKRLREYEKLIPKVVEEWRQIVCTCETAKHFEGCIRNTIGSDLREQE